MCGDGKYERGAPRDGEDVAVEGRRGAADVERKAAATPGQSTQVYAYSKHGRSEAQAVRDGYDCHLWAVEQSGFDPSEPADRTDLIPDYRRAMTACLEGRGYSVK